MKRFSIYERDVLISLWRKADYYKSATFFCSDKQIARDIGIHPDTVKRAKRYLAASGWIRYTSGKHEGRATEYQILRRHDGRKIFIPLWKMESPAESAPLESHAESPAVSRSSNIYERDILLADARHTEEVSVDNSASALTASAEPRVDKLRVIEDIQSEQPDDHHTEDISMDTTASALTASVAPQVQRLRPIEETRREHPDAIRNSSGLGEGTLITSVKVNHSNRIEKLSYVAARTQYPQGKKFINSLGHEYWAYGNDCFSWRRSKREDVYS